MARYPPYLNKFSLEGSLVYKSILEQAEAYFDHCRGNFELARNRTLEALIIDVVLEEKYGYEMILHRIQLVQNLARIDAGCMWFESAIKLNCQILNYLEGELEILPISGSWSKELITRQSSLVSVQKLRGLRRQPKSEKKLLI